MAEQRKDFFRTRTASEVKRLSKKKTVFRKREFSDELLSMSESDYLEVRVQILPGHLYAQTELWKDASRKGIKWTDNFLLITQPGTQTEALKSRETVLELLRADFSRLAGLRQEELTYTGYSFKPVQGNDKKRRFVPFAYLAEAENILEFIDSGKSVIQYKVYGEAKVVEREGATVLGTVPSMTKKKPRYKLRLDHLPFKDSDFALAISLGMSTDFSSETPHSHEGTNVRFSRSSSREASDALTFYPHPIALYNYVAQKLDDEDDNIVPMKYSPFLRLTDEERRLYDRLENNVVIFDKSLSSKDKLRKLHLAEKSMILGAYIINSRMSR